VSIEPLEDLALNGDIGVGLGRPVVGVVVDMTFWSRKDVN
jgi:hypothetical protein